MQKTNKKFQSPCGPENKVIDHDTFVLSAATVDSVCSPSSRSPAPSAWSPGPPVQSPGSVRVD